MTVGYYSNDMVATQVQSTKTKTFTLDPARRLRTATDATSGSETRRMVNHYNNTDDTPTWINTSTNAGTTWTWQRNITGVDGNLAILQDQSGTPQIQIANPHGDIVATSDDTTASTSTNAYFEQTEYGAPRTSNAANPLRYGWLGAKQRSGDDLAGLTLMGVRLYNPATGRFLSNDPVPGGNENSYNYPNNPVDEFDLNGTWFHSALHWAGRHKLDIALTVASVVVPEAGAAIWAYRAYRVTRLAEAGVEGVRATRATSWAAGRMWVGRGGVKSVAKNGSRMYSKGEGAAQRAWRGSAKKGKFGHSSNLTRSVKGRHDYTSFHIKHQPPSRWMPWR